MQLVDVLGNDHAFAVLPGPTADAVAGIDRRLAVGSLRAEIGVPSVAAGSDCLGELLAEPVGAREAAEIRTLAGAGAGDKKRRVGLLRQGAGIDAEHERDRYAKGRRAHRRIHPDPPAASRGYRCYDSRAMKIIHAPVGVGSDLLHLIWKLTSSACGVPTSIMNSASATPSLRK